MEGMNMLSKLMKYDLRSCFRRFGVLWIATAAFAVLTGIMMHGVFEKAMESGSFILRFLTILVPVILIGLIIVTGVLTFVFICERFYKGLLGDEGYLMFTLPASVSEHIAAKALSAMILTIISSLVALVSGLIFLLIYQPAELMEGLRMLPQILKEADLPASVPLFLLEILVLILFTVAKETLKIYASIALGHLAKKHRVLWAILAYFGITTLESLARGLVISNGLFSRLEAWAEEADWGIIYTNGTWSVTGIGMLAGIIGLLILVYLIMSAVYFIVTKVILTRKLNLE
jgi:hypothetical protein